MGLENGSAYGDSDQAGLARPIAGMARPRVPTAGEAATAAIRGALFPATERMRAQRAEVLNIIVSRSDGKRLTADDVRDYENMVQIAEGQQ